jgi:hypothetical protein
MTYYRNSGGTYARNWLASTGGRLIGLLNPLRTFVTADLAPVRFCTSGTQTRPFAFHAPERFGDINFLTLACSLSGASLLLVHILLTRFKLGIDILKSEEALH